MPTLEGISAQVTGLSAQLTNLQMSTTNLETNMGAGQKNLEDNISRVHGHVIRLENDLPTSTELRIFPGQWVFSNGTNNVWLMILSNGTDSKQLQLFTSFVRTTTNLEAINLYNTGHPKKLQFNESYKDKVFLVRDNDSTLNNYNSVSGNIIMHGDNSSITLNIQFSNTTDSSSTGKLTPNDIFFNSTISYSNGEFTGIFDRFGQDVPSEFLNKQNSGDASVWRGDDFNLRVYIGLGGVAGRVGFIRNDTEVFIVMPLFSAEPATLSFIVPIEYASNMALTSTEEILDDKNIKNITGVGSLNDSGDIIMTFTAKSSSSGNLPTYGDNAWVPNSDNTGYTKTYVYKKST